MGAGGGTSWARAFCSRRELALGLADRLRQDFWRWPRVLVRPELGCFTWNTLARVCTQRGEGPNPRAFVRSNVSRPAWRLFRTASSRARGTLAAAAKPSFCPRRLPARIERVRACRWLLMQE